MGSSLGHQLSPQLEAILAYDNSASPPVGILRTQIHLRFLPSTLRFSRSSRGPSERTIPFPEIGKFIACNVSLIDQPCKTLRGVCKVTATSIKDTIHPAPPPRPSMAPPGSVLHNEHTVALVWSSSLLLSRPANRSLDLVISPLGNVMLSFTWSPSQCGSRLSLQSSQACV